MARAAGSYPAGRRFKSYRGYVDRIFVVYLANNTTRQRVISGPYISSQVDKGVNMICVYDSKETCNELSVHQFDKILFTELERNIDGPST